jgi:hypothetical protein
VIVLIESANTQALGEPIVFFNTSIEFLPFTLDDLPNLFSFIPGKIPVKNMSKSPVLRYFLKNKLNFKNENDKEPYAIDEIDVNDFKAR